MLGGSGGWKMVVGDIGELLVFYMFMICVFRFGDRVYKNECVFFYDFFNFEGGFYVCMNIFLVFGREYVERYF